MQLTGLGQLIDLARSKGKQHLVAVWAMDEHSLKAIHMAVQHGLVEATIVGDEQCILEICRKKSIDASVFSIVNETSDRAAAFRAVDLINDRKGNLLMKGTLSTDKYMRAILDKDRGMAEPGAIISHVTVMKIAAYHKLLIFGDVAIIPLPDLRQKIAIVKSLVNIARTLGIDKPKLAVLAATEQVLPGMPACIDAAIISKMAERGQIKDAVVDGPLSLDLSINPDAARIKKIISNVAGDADCILFPNIESGNVFYKTNVLYSGSEQAAIITGARVPAVLSSRGDSALTKLNSIALAAMLAKQTS
jgi:phosphotransacetylase